MELVGDVIIEADGKEVKNNGDLIRAISDKKEGDVTLTIIRDRNRQTVQITPEKLKGELTPVFDEMTPPAITVQPLAPKMQNAPYTVTTPLVAPAPAKRIL